MEREPLTRRERVEQYYKTLLEQGSNELSSDIVAYILLGIGMMLLFVPIQEIFAEGGEFRAIVWCVACIMPKAHL